MKTKSFTLISILLLATARAAWPADPLSETFQKGLLEEEANHNLEAAIQAYQSVINQYDEQRKITATAVFRLAECYLKQGQTNEAVRRYQRIVQEFADQSTLLQSSEQRLALAGRPGATAAGDAPAGTVTDPAQLELLRQEVKLAEQEAAAAEANLKNGRGKFADLARVRKDLLVLQRQLPEYASSAAQKGLVEQQVKLVEQMLAERKKQIEVGAAAPGDDFPLQRELIGLRRELLGVSKTPPAARPETDGGSPASPEEEERKKIEQLRNLIKESPDLIDARDTAGQTPLHYAATRGELMVEEFLLDHGADVNSRNSLGETALHIATRGGHKASVELLLSRKASVNAKNNDGASPLSIAASKGFLAIADLLLARGADVKAQTERGVLPPFARPGSFGGPNKLYLGATPLHYAAAGGFHALVKLLLDRQAEMNSQTQGGCTPLYAAADFDRLEVVKLLLSRHAEPNAKAVDGTTPLGLAVKNDNLEMVKTLVAAGADLNAACLSAQEHRLPSDPPNLRLTPLTYAARVGRADMVRLLLQEKAEINVQNELGATPLGGAVESSSVDVVRLLLENGADPNIKGREGDTPLFRCAVNGKKEMVDLLLAHKADPNAANGAGVAPLHMAALGPYPGVVEMLLAHGANANAADSNGLTPLHDAVWGQDKEIIEALIAHGANVNASNRNGQTPIELTKHPLPSRTPGNAQYNPIFQAGTPVNAAEIAELLRKHGAKD